MRKLEVRNTKQGLNFFVDDKQLTVAWDSKVIQQAAKSGKIYPQFKDQLIKTLRDRLEASAYKLTPDEVNGLVKLVRAETGL